MISGVQKFLRSRDPVGMRYCVLELLALEQRVATSNLINRLQVMAVEELLFADTIAFKISYDLISAAGTNRQNLGPLLRVCDVLCASRLCRIPSDVRCHFGALGQDHLEELLQNFPVPALFPIAINWDSIPLADHPPDIQKLVQLFARLLVCN